MREGGNGMNNAFGAAENTAKNLSRIAREQAVLSERRILELYDVTASALATSKQYALDGLTAYEILSAIDTDTSFSEYSEGDGTPDEVSASLTRTLSSLPAMDRIVFSDLYSDGAEKEGIPVAEADLLPTADGDETFIYLRNSLADEAYDVFSQDFDDPRVRYATTLVECARAVENGDARFCLLPFEERGGSRLPTVSEIIYRHDLKVNAVTPVFGFDGTADLKYALLSRDFIIPECAGEDDRYLEVRVRALDPIMAELFLAVSYFGHTLYRTDTVSFNTEGETSRFFSLVIRDGGCGFGGLLVYLSLFADDFTPVGIYKNLE